MKKRRLFSMAMASLVVVSILAAFPMRAGAAGSSYATELADGSVNTTVLEKVLVIEDDVDIPACSFTFTATAGKAVEAGGDTLAVLAGVNPTKIKFGTETAADGNGIIAYVAQNKTATVDGVTITDDNPDNDHYTATKSTTLDFSECGFTEPGVYRYIITESGTNAGVTNDNVLKRTLDVYVEDAKAWYDAQTDKTGLIDPGTDTKQLKITNYVMYSDEISAAPGADGTAAGTKSSSYTNTYAAHNLTFGKEVTGNQGSKDKYFKFTLAISGATAGTVYNVDLSDADATSGTNAATATENQGKNNPTSITVGTGGTVSTEFYLQHGQSIVIKGIADGTAYTITEAEEDYTPTVALIGDTKTGENEGTAIATGANKNSIADTALKANTKITFTNDRSGTIPTGILLSIAPVVMIGILVIGGMVFLIVRNRRREAEEA